MSQSSNARSAESKEMDDGEVEQEQKQARMVDDPSVARFVVSASSASTLASSSADARAQLQLARRSHVRSTDEQDSADRDIRRMDSLVAKVTAREARHAATAAAAQWRSFGPAQRLFKDGIALCLGFLSLKEFNSAAQACKGWRAGALRVKSLGGSVLKAPGRVLLSMLRSPFRVLMSGLIALDSVPLSCGELCGECAPLRSLFLSWNRGLVRGLASLSNLTSIDIPLNLAQPVAPIRYPRMLCSARLEIGCLDLMGEHTVDAAVALRGLQLCASLSRLDLKLVEVPFALTSLASLTQLHSLTIDGYVHLHYNSATLNVIKTLPLESLALLHTEDEDFNMDGDAFDPEWLSPLLTAPHQLQRMQKLDSGGSVYLWDSAFVMELLPSLPSLTEIQFPGCDSVAALPVLAAFPQLRTLHLDFDSSADIELHEDNEGVDAAYDEHGCARLSVLVPHLAHCSLTELTLWHISDDGESLAAVCKSHPQLKSVCLRNAALSTVQPLATLHQLTQLTLELAAHSDGLPQLFEQIGQCKLLHKLELKGITPALTEAQQQQLRPPSLLLPRLTEFKDTSRA